MYLKSRDHDEHEDCLSVKSNGTVKELFILSHDKHLRQVGLKEEFAEFWKILLWIWIYLQNQTPALGGLSC